MLINLKYMKHVMLVRLILNWAGHILNWVGHILNKLELVLN